MFKQRKTEAHDRGQDLWFLIPESERTAVRVLDDLTREGFKVSKATVCRWAKQWKRVPIEAVNLVPLPSKGTEAACTDDLADIPEWVRKALPERLWIVARGKGLDRVEHAICLLSDAIGAQAKQLVQNDRSLLVASQALLAMASAIHQVSNSRAIAAIAHRSFCEGDLAAAKGKKAEAEAQVATREGRTQTGSDGL